MNSSESIASRILRLPLALKSLLFAISYFAATHYSLQFRFSPEGLCPFWLQSGLAFGVLLVSPRREWWALLSVLFFVHFGTSITLGYSPGPAMLFALANTLEPLLASTLVGFLKVGRPYTSTLRSFALVLSAGVPAVVFSATLGAGGLHLMQGDPFAKSWLIWFWDDLGGIILSLPLVLSWLEQQQSRELELRNRSRLEIRLFWLLFASVLFCAWALEPKSVLGVLFQLGMFTFVLWAATRFTFFNLSLVLTLSALVWTHSIFFGVDPGSLDLENWKKVVLVHGFLMIVAVPALFFRITLSERDRGLEALSQSERRFRLLSENLHSALTEAKRIKEDLISEKNFFKASAEALPGLFYVLHPEKGLQRWNRNVEELLGYQGKDLLGANPSNFFPQEEREKMGKALDRVLSEGEVTIETLVLARDGSRKPFLFTGRSFPAVEGTLVLGMGIDISARLEAERLLAEREKKYRLLISQAYEAIVIADSDGRIVEVNEAATKLLSHSKAEFSSMSLTHLLSESGELGGSLVRLVMAGRSVVREKELRTSEGSKVPVEISAKQIPGGMVQLVMRDITERRKAENRLLESERRFRSLAEASSVGIWQIAPEGLTQYINPTMCLMLQVDGPQDLEGKTFHGWFTEASLSTFQREHARRPQGESSNYVVELIGKMGRRLEVLVSGAPVTGADGRLQGLIGTFLDITEIRKAEREMRRSKESLSLLISNVPGVVYRRRSTGIWNFVFLSDGIHDITGYPAYDFLENSIIHFEELVHDADKPLIEKQIEDALHQGRSFEITYRIHTASGKIKWVWEKGKAIGANDKGNQDVEGVMMDVTRMKAAEESAREMSDNLERRVRERTGQLEAANRDLESFSYSVSHDLRAPLRAIDGFSSILKEDYGEHLLPGAAEVLDVVRANVRRMDELIHGLLRFSRISRQDMQQVPLDMKGLAEEAWSEVTRAEPGRTVDFIPGPLLGVSGDSILMRQVWINLLGNAMKFTRTRKPARIEIESESVDGFVRYIVKDNGIGFDPNLAEKLFEVFHRLHTESEYEGTGVGLAIVKRIVDKHGGDIRATGKPDQGAEFSFSLPAGPRS